MSVGGSYVDQGAMDNRRAAERERAAPPHLGVYY